MGRKINFQYYLPVFAIQNLPHLTPHIFKLKNAYGEGWTLKTKMLPCIDSASNQKGKMESMMCDSTYARILREI